MGKFTALFIAYQWMEAACDADTQGIAFEWLPSYR